MQTVFGLLVSLCLAMALAEGEVPECPGVAEETLAQIKSLLVTEDIHDKMAGDYHELWGPKVFMEGDDNACVKYTWTKVDDTHLTMVIHAKGAWFNGDITRNLTAEKIGNGVYLLKKDNGEAAFREYHLSNKEHVRAVFSCAQQVPAPGSKEAAVAHFATVAVHSHDLKTPMEADVQAEVDEVVKKVQDHKDALGEIVHFTHAC